MNTANNTLELTAEEIAILEAFPVLDDGIDHVSCFTENNDLPF